MLTSRRSRWRWTVDFPAIGGRKGDAESGEGRYVDQNSKGGNNAKSHSTGQEGKVGRYKHRDGRNDGAWGQEGDEHAQQEGKLFFFLFCVRETVLIIVVNFGDAF